MSEAAARAQLVELGRSLFDRGYSVGTAGNISVRLADGYLMTPTNSCLGRLDAARISRLGPDWAHQSGDKPSKEVFLHRAVLQARPEAGAVVHLHSTHATAIACLAPEGGDAEIPPLTPYFVMRIGRRLPCVPYYRPGDAAMEPAVHAAALAAKALLLANHGPVVSGATLADAVHAAEELEEAARLALLLRGVPGLRALNAAQVDDLLRQFG
ncbi:3-oxo-tetronate 4-phosphate decarboxylase [Falsiroseomonas selenitidurans]|uniref:3-oxo-tetronate 4-phosphate decarboxylase n=1 Tax=Falsiroseomonas selenitidurans TaxID=2716335 RepID=A0ABX1DYN4_9PROT|nr:aldolase [Falsiroseomonas selenitidurans]NKC29976.1 aldolase [Falsiroseomonas selenitidurans]OYW10541.1 MAG: aldolase [Rhodospirillales bacterium 12-71-4]